MNPWPYILGCVLGLLVCGVAVFTVWMFNRAQERAEKHLRATMDRFLSRNFSEYNMGNIIRGEIAVDQEQPQPEDLETIQKWERETESFLEDVEVARTAGARR